MELTYITAHTGCDGTDDNSIAFLDYAFNLPVDTLEVDVRKNNRSDLVLAHDEGTHHALLTDAFTRLRSFPTKMLNCDLKAPGLELAVWELAKGFGVDKQIIFSGEVSFEAMKKHERLFRHVRWYLNIELIFPDIYQKERRLPNGMDFASAARHVGRLLEEYHATCLNVHYGMYDTEFGKALRHHGVRLSLWTPSEEGELRFFLSEGVYNLTTRNAAAACEIRRLS